ASDGEILVQGPNVARFFDSQSDPEHSERLRTGDIGRIDEEGNLYYLGRKKDVIVTREGQNVYPEDVENVLRELPHVTDCAVVGRQTQRGTVVHAVFIFKDSRTRPEDAVQRANPRLEAHQRIRSWSVWPQSDFPRTPSTGKIQRRKVATAVSTQERPKAQADKSSVRGIVAGFASREVENISGQERLEEDLGLSSMDRVEIMSLIEQELGLTIDEQVMTSVRTVGELEKAVGQEGPQKEKELESSMQEQEIPEPEPAAVIGKDVQDEPRSTGLRVPAWKGYFPCRWLRTAFQATVLPATTRIFLGLRISGLEHLAAMQPPVIFAANHSSHMDTPALLTALPLSWRLRVAPAVRQDYFWPLLQPEQTSWHNRLASRGKYILLGLFLNIYPLPQRTAGVRRALRYAGRLVDAGECPLIFPEGMRTPNGRIQPFQRGVGFMARELDVPIVPVRLSGLFELFSIHHRLPRPGRAEVAFGPPVYPSPDVDAAGLTSQVQNRIQDMHP
ncbi:MAG: 1-acyl-sn-glycerol-3-phosphate acyltransferase, partial [Desulfovermiculus sp.]